MHYGNVELDKYDDIENEEFYDYENTNPVRILEKAFNSTKTAATENVC